MADTSKGNSAPNGEHAKEQAQHMLQQGKETVGHAWEFARAQFWAQANTQKERAATRLDDFSQLIRQTGTQLKDQGHSGSSDYANQIAGKLDQVAAGIHDKEIGELVADTEEYARHNPAIFLCAAATVGFVLTRFLRSSSQAA